jgi:dTDP-4-dehydrorhamnose reductase
MRSLVIGASGFVGKSLYSILKQTNEVIFGTYFSRYREGLIRVDMTSIKELEFVFKKSDPEIVYMPAFIPGVDRCELDKNICKINEMGVRNVINLCKKHETRIVFFSSDYVFDGNSGPYLESDEPNPINKYGETKLLCESFVKELNEYLIIRTAVVYGYDEESKNYFMTFSRDLMNKKKKKVPIDQFSTPTFVIDLALITIDLVNKNKNGIYNVTGPNYCSRYTFALKIADKFNFNKNLIKPVLTKELNQAARRPLKAGLINNKVRFELNVNPLGIDDVLNEIKIAYNKFKRTT